MSPSSCVSQSLVSQFGWWCLALSGCLSSRVRLSRSSAFLYLFLLFVSQSGWLFSGSPHVFAPVSPALFKSGCWCLAPLVLHSRFWPQLNLAYLLEVFYLTSLRQSALQFLSSCVSQSGQSGWWCWALRVSFFTCFPSFVSQSSVVLIFIILYCLRNFWSCVYLTHATQVSSMISCR